MAWLLRDRRSPGWPRRLVLAILLLIWAGFWTWFAVVQAWVDGGGAWKHAVEFVGPIILLTVLAFWCPMAGGLGLIAGGIAAATFFHHPLVMALLCLPPVLLGVGLISWRPGVSVPGHSR